MFKCLDNLKAFSLRLNFWFKEADLSAECFKAAWLMSYILWSAVGQGLRNMLLQTHFRLMRF